MSLKVEQRLDNFFFTETEPRIYSTGVFLVPLEIKKGKEKRYVWVVDEFNDDTYLDGRICYPISYANSIDDLLEK